ncbi:MAG: hypothetical protein ACI9U2_000329 [Bradymonadia bacterium]|jgi:hypothetical protein
MPPRETPACRARAPTWTAQTRCCLLPLTRESRHCEVLLFRMSGGALTADVWGSQGLSDSPAAD